MTRKLLLLAGVIIGTCSLGLAGACPSGFGVTVATYEALGAGGCTIGSLTFSNFSYTSTSSGGAIAVPADGVAVTPQTGAEAGFTFVAPWSASVAESVGSVITYTVTAAPATSITDLLLSIAGFGTFGGANVIVAETTPTPPLSLMVFDNAGSMKFSDSAPFAGVSSLTVTKGIAVTANGGVGHLSVVTNEFSTSTVPEPASMLLLGSGLLGLAGFVRRRRAGRSA